jgi:hypothetical protein
MYGLDLSRIAIDLVAPCPHYVTAEHFHKLSRAAGPPGQMGGPASVKLPLTKSV